MQHDGRGHRSAPLLEICTHPVGLPDVSLAKSVPARGRNMDDDRASSVRVVCQTGVEIFLYVANISGGTIDVFDRCRKHVGSFTDPSLPRGYVPVELRVLDGNLFVAFSHRDAVRQDAPAEADYGVIAEFNSDGVVLDRAEFRSGRRRGAAWHRQMPDQGATGHAWRKRARRAVRSRQPAF
jgi:hypothetical protein